MSGNKISGAKAAKTNLAKDPDFYRKIGALGGQKGAKDGTIKGFATATPEQRIEWGRKGGLKSRRVPRKVPFYEGPMTSGRWDELEVALFGQTTNTPPTRQKLWRKIVRKFRAPL